MINVLLLASCNEKKADEKPNNKVDLTNDFSNKRMVPLIDNCKTEQTLSCLQNTISELILAEAKSKMISLKNDTLQVGILIKADGSTSIKKNESSNSLLKKVSFNVLNSLPPIEPAYTEFQKKYVSYSFSWFIIIQNDEIINRLEE